MTDEEKRTLLFLLGCVSARAGFAALAKNAAGSNLQKLGYVALFPALAMMLAFLGGFRKSGPETMNQPIWWNRLRPVHAVMYATFAYLAINGNQEGWKVLIADLMIGLGAFAFIRETQIHSP